MADARARLASVTAADKGAGIREETDAYTKANGEVLEAEQALRASRRAARTEVAR